MDVLTAISIPLNCAIMYYTGQNSWKDGITSEDEYTSSIREYLQEQNPELWDLASILLLIVLIEQILRQGVTNNLIPDWLIGANQVSQIRFMLMGLGLMLLMIYRPQGIFGDKKELALDAKA